MIRRVKNADIEISKFETCVRNSAQRMYCATANFLEIACGKNWEVLVRGDYDAVMPVPYIKKWGLKLVLNPVLCQQLGVFSKMDSASENENFLKFFEQNYRVAYYAFNSKNNFKELLSYRTNYVILRNSYAVVRQNYSPKRRQKLIINDEVQKNTEIRELSWQESGKFMHHHVPGLFNEKLKREYFRILARLYEKKLLELEGFFYHGKLINVVLIYRDSKAAVLFGTFNDRDQIKLNGASILIDRAIRRHVEVRDFDFEGSEVPSVAEFFRGFRPVQTHFAVVKNSKKDLLKKIIKF